MKNKRLLVLGVFALLLAVGLNVRHALNDYGIKDSKLHIEAMARTVDDGDTKICYFPGTTNYSDFYSCEDRYPSVGTCGNTERQNMFFSNDKHVCD